MRSTQRVSLVTVLALVVVTGSATTSLGSRGWPQDGYDGGHTYANTQEWRLRPGNVHRLRLLWSRSIRTAHEGWIYEHIGVPVVRAAAYAWWAAEAPEPLQATRALSPGAGRTIWLRSREWVVAAASQTTVYMNDRSSGGWRVLSLDASTGRRGWARWGISVFAASSSIERLFVRTRIGVGVIEASTGEDVWMRDGIVLDGTPLVSRGVIVGRATLDGPDAIVGLDAETGDTLWERALRRRHGSWNSSYPEAASGGLVYVVGRSFPTSEVSTIRALRLDDGSTAWRRLLRDDVPSVSAVGGGRVFVTRQRCATPDGCFDDWFRGRGALLSLDARTGRSLWRISGIDGSPRPLWSAGALANRLVFASGVRRWRSFGLSRVVAISAATGRILWTADVPRAFVFVSAVADGRLYVVTAGGSRGGRVLAFGLPGS